MKTRFYYYLICLSLTFSCQNTSKKPIEKAAVSNDDTEEIVMEQAEPKKEKTVSSEKAKTPISLPISNEKIQKLIDQHQNKFDAIPFSANYNGLPLYYTLIGAFNEDEPFANNKYGLIDSLGRELLIADYDKIYMPEQVLKQCVEIEKEGLIGLFNLENGKILEPQFRYIFSLDTSLKKCFGVSLNGSCVQIKVDHNFNIKQTEVSPRDFFLNLDVMYAQHKYETVTSNYSFHSAYGDELNDVHISSSGFYKNNLVKEISLNSINSTLMTVEEKEPKKGLFGIILEFYDGSFDARDYTISEIKAAAITEKTSVLELTDLGNDFFAQGYAKKWFKNDSIIEVENYSDEYFNPSYNYFKVTEKGVISLKCNRTYNFTKFVKIDSLYFKGPFTIEENDSIYKIYKEEGDDYPFKYGKSHLTIRELNIMRNEVFADYGYKFQSEKWLNYFNNKPWYKPRYENVDAFLSKIDEHNVKAILNATKAIKEGKTKVVRQAYFYSAAG